MNFPSFGDAEAYAELGRACADAIAGPGRVFDGCYHPIRPLGSALLMAVPYLATDDPVDAAYAALALNMMFFAGVVACLANALIGERSLLEGRPWRAELLAGAAFALLLANLVAHLPVRLADLPSLAPFVAALLVAARTVGGPGSGRPLLRRYLACGALCSLAVLLKVTYLAYAFFLLVSLLALDRSARGSRLRCAAVFVLGMSPVAIQVLNVFLHTGQLGFYDREFMRAHFPHREYGVEAVIFTIPDRGAQVAADTSRLNVRSPSLDAASSTNPLLSRGATVVATRRRATGLPTLTPRASRICLNRVGFSPSARQIAVAVCPSNSRIAVSHRSSGIALPCRFARQTSNFATTPSSSRPLERIDTSALRVQMRSLDSHAVLPQGHAASRAQGMADRRRPGLWDARPWRASRSAPDAPRGAARLRAPVDRRGGAGG